eukprot:NODE_1684_length_2403_cov_12.676186.p1 GENE.NODE_1684_length_2403_cov_12.676186~~NODE_1684_length_2403_cov_12.676186.p1  ORF type:complete len:752 (-),score=177.89 NODE_1684_length_2403_cov_12.676186:147-2087(-)
MSSVLHARNKRGETPFEAILGNKNVAAHERSEIICTLVKNMPTFGAMLTADGSPLVALLNHDERSLVPPPPVAWADVRAVLLSGHALALEQGLAGLAKRLVAVWPSCEISDHAAVWTGLLSEHCFGSVVCASAGAGAGAAAPVKANAKAEGGGATSDEGAHAPLLGKAAEAPGDNVEGQDGHVALKHTKESWGRLRTVWRALEMLFKHCSNVDAEHLKDCVRIARGLLVATRGPNAPGFDPREPYRMELVRFVHRAQDCTAQQLGTHLAQALAVDDAAAQEIGDIPRDELHSVDTEAAVARGALSRLRMDSRLVQAEAGATVSPLSTPDWVFDHVLDADALEELRTWSGVATAREVIDLATPDGGAACVDGMSEERMRFCRLHAAWMRGFCCQRQLELVARIHGALGLPQLLDDAAGHQLAGGAIACGFRARDEPKGLPRMLEKMMEALGEEVVQGRAAELLQTDLRSFDHSSSCSSDGDGDADADAACDAALGCDQVALQELLTPACYVCDVNGAEIVLESLADIVSLYKTLRNLVLEYDGCQVVRTKNGFSNAVKDEDLKGGYRDLKLWLMLNAGGTALAAELQVHLKTFHSLKSVMHLPYECSRGSFDHPQWLHLWLQRESPAAVTIASESATTTRSRFCAIL